MFTNPVLTGCYPDASVCRAGDDFYLVTSSFEYFPGLPVFRSTDLVNWTQVAHVVSRPDQLDLSGVPSSGGLFAPTIRYFDGTFYVVCTLVNGTGRQGNFLMTAIDPVGPWSDPIWLDVDGIDPSLLFDDGRVWMCGTRLADPGLWKGQTDVWLRELDLDRGILIGQEHLIWRGALVGARWAEGPHLYRVGDGYLLLAAEGGTERNHAVSVARSLTVTGPYVGNPGNPVLTHRDLGGSAPIVGVGHAELIEDANGDWWSTVLATRTVDGDGSMLGRETNLVPVVWEAGWPVFAPGAGRVPREAEGPSAVLKPRARDDFEGATLDLAWNEVRTSDGTRYSLDARPGWLRLPALPAAVTRADAPAFVGRRVQHLAASAGTLLDFAPSTADESAGLLLRQSEDYQIRVAIEAVGSGRRVVAVRRLGGVDKELASAPVNDGVVELRIRIEGGSCALSFTFDGVECPLAETSCAELGSETAGGFLGVWVGMFATSNGTLSTAVADFDWFDYAPNASKVRIP
jgi:xylan 1,4-beta-xylosidase